MAYELAFHLTAKLPFPAGRLRNERAAAAIENSRLYQQQIRQTEELSLLKEFNESIVESVNVGLLAVDEDEPGTGPRQHARQ